MTKKPSKSSPHSSMYGGGYVSSSKYVAELICVKCADKKKEFLTDCFWEKPQWKGFYKQQCRAAASLLKLYSVQAIIKALADKRAWSIYSLQAQFLDNIIAEYQKTEDIPIQKEVIEVTETIAAPKATLGNQSLASKLRDL